jgi:glucosamine--fructose-6-phosphate aminotransferase (isomerizing)
MLAARGTSDNAAAFGRYLLEIGTGIPVSLAAPSVFTLYGVKKFDFREALVVAISQSGESTDINVVLEAAKAQGAVTVGITNEPDSALARLAEHVFMVHAGKEKSVAATKTYSGQLLTLYLLAYALGAPIRLDDLRRLPGYAESALTLQPQIEAVAQRYRFMENAVVVGRGLNYANAFEFALKMMETCYVVAERFSSADFLHGPIAIVGAHFPAFLFAPPGVTWPSMKELVAKLSVAGAEMFVISDKSNKDAKHIEGGRGVMIPVALAHKGPLPAGSLHADSVYHPRPAVRRFAGARERPRSRPAARVIEGDSDIVGRSRSRPCATNLADAPVDPAAQNSATSPHGSSNSVWLLAMTPAIFFCSCSRRLANS